MNTRNLIFLFGLVLLLAFSHVTGQRFLDEDYNDNERNLTGNSDPQTIPTAVTAAIATIAERFRSGQQGTQGTQGRPEGQGQGEQVTPPPTTRVPRTPRQRQAAPAAPAGAGTTGAVRGGVVAGTAATAGTGTTGTGTSQPRAELAEALVGAVRQHLNQCRDNPDCTIRQTLLRNILCCYNKQWPSTPSPPATETPDSDPDTNLNSGV